MVVESAAATIHTKTRETRKNTALDEQKVASNEFPTATCRPAGVQHLRKLGRATPRARNSGTLQPRYDEAASRWSHLCADVAPGSCRLSALPRVRGQPQAGSAQLSAVPGMGRSPQRSRLRLLGDRTPGPRVGSGGAGRHAVAAERARMAPRGDQLHRRACRKRSDADQPPLAQPRHRRPGSRTRGDPSRRHPLAPLPGRHRPGAGPLVR